MPLLTPGYWPATYWPANYWPDNYWANYGAGPPPTPAIASFPYLEAHNICPDGMTRGDYTHVPTTLRTINKDHNAVEVNHSLFEGDRMSFFQVLTSRNNALDRMRPIRFYSKDPDDDGIKLFDGIITDSEYTYIGSDYMALRTNAVGWWKELATMSLHHPITYLEADNWTVNEIYTDLVRLANDRGVMKEAVYSYDTNKIPEYSTYSSYYEVPIETEIVVTNVYEGMKTLTRFLDATTPCTYEFGLRIEALPRTDGITQADTEDNIYILPFPINQDKAAAATLKQFQLAAGHEVRRDYRRLANDCLAIGDGYDSQQIRTTQLLTEKTITAADQSWPRDNPTLASHYFRVTLENPTASALNGYIIITQTGVVPLNTETFPMHAPAYTTQAHFTSERAELPTGDCFRAVGLNGGKITVEEVSNDEYPAPDTGIFHTTIAGKSRNQYGHAPHTIEGLWLNSQQRVDRIAGKHCRLYHAPTHELYAPIIARYASYDNLIGNVADLHTPYEMSLEAFLITDAVYGFRGKLVTQHLMGMRYEFDWDYDGTQIYVMVGTDYVMVGTAKVVI